jgi:hypothetical protein
MQRIVVQATNIPLKTPLVAPTLTTTNTQENDLIQFDLAPT